jgi:putative membrane protein
MITDALLAYAHFLAIFALASTLVAEALLFRQRMTGPIFARLRIVDRWYGITAGLVVLTGLGRLFGGVKGVAYYSTNPIFWTKIGLFVVVGLISIAPTIAYIRWTKRADVDGSLALEPDEFTQTRNLIRLQIAIFIFIPLCATFMARGFH